VIPHNQSRIRLAAATIAVAMGRQNRRSSVTRMRARRLHIETLRPQPFMADGQIRDVATCFDIELLPAAIQVIVPDKGGRK
jgi:diacylglycerol kinase family enzyme